VNLLPVRLRQPVQRFWAAVHVSPLQTRFQALFLLRFHGRGVFQKPFYGVRPRLHIKSKAHGRKMAKANRSGTNSPILSERSKVGRPATSPVTNIIFTPQDLALAKRLNQKSYRFSMSWRRIQSSGTGPPNMRGIDHYGRLVDAMLEHGIRPFCTIYHWDLPQALEDRRGWPNRDLASYSAEIPGAESAAITSDLPATGAGRVTLALKGELDLPANQKCNALDFVVTTDFFGTAGIPLLRGRTFTETDNSSAPRVVVNQQFVHQHLRDQEPLRKQIRLDVAGVPAEWRLLRFRPSMTGCIQVGVNKN
jgi:Glycosyl hydrolase family 1